MLGIVGVWFSVVGGYLDTFLQPGRRNDDAQKEMFQAIRYFENILTLVNDNLKLPPGKAMAISGSMDIIDHHGKHQGRKLASFMPVLHLKQGDYKARFSYFRIFLPLTCCSRRARIACWATDMEQGEFAKAGDFYNKAANYKPNKFFSPTYLMKVRFLRKQNQNDKGH